MRILPNCKFLVEGEAETWTDIKVVSFNLYMNWHDATNMIQIKRYQYDSTGKLILKINNKNGVIILDENYRLIKTGWDEETQTCIFYLEKF